MNEHPFVCYGVTKMFVSTSFWFGDDGTRLIEVNGCFAFFILIFYAFLKKLQNKGIEIKAIHCKGCFLRPIDLESVKNNTKNIFLSKKKKNFIRKINF